MTLMSTSFQYQTSYTLDKSHFTETFEQSVNPTLSVKLFYKAFIYLVVGVYFMFFLPVSGYLAWFVVSLAAVEALSVRYRKPWWVTRQMFSRAAGSELSLTINAQGIEQKSPYISAELTWAAMITIEETSAGFLIHTQKGKIYLSKRVLSEQAIAYILSHRK